MATPTARARGGDGQLTPAEVDALLDGPIVARVAFVTPECAPYVVPLWQEWDGQAMWFIVRERSAFVDFLRHNPRMAASCAIDGDGNARVLLEGAGEIVAGPGPLVDATLAMAERMATRYMGERGPEYVRRTTERPRYWITLTPTRLTSWRGAEWAAKYRR